MMLETSVQIRRRGAQDFGAYYDYVCGLQDIVPLSSVKANLSSGVLDFNGDRIKLPDWVPILNSLAINKHLHHVGISSGHQADRSMSSYRNKSHAFHSKEMTFRLCKAVRDCLSISPNLRTLQLHGLPLRERDLLALTKGLAKSTSIERLSLARCPIADEGLETVCQSVKYSSCIKTVDFTGCNLTWRGAEHLANIVQHQALRRHDAAWAESLRYRKPEFEGMGGLRRITLNGNTLIGDRGAAALAKELTEDLWVKAVDLQMCGLSNDGARVLLAALKSNSTLCVLDLRRNPLVDNGLIKTIIERVLVNTNGLKSEYSWIKPFALKESQKATGQKRRFVGTIGRGKALYRIGSHRLTSGAAQPLGPASSRQNSQRSGTRTGLYRGVCPCGAVREPSLQDVATVMISMESEEEEEGEESQRSPLLTSLKKTPQHIKGLQVELEDCHLRLLEEQKARAKADACLVECKLENVRLRGINQSLVEALQAQSNSSSVLEEDRVLDSIESSFRKFNAFLDLLKDAGLGQLASMAGIDQSVFGSMGGPLLSSTMDRTAAKAGEQDTRENGDMRVSQDPSGLWPSGSAHRAPRSLEGFALEESPQSEPISPPSEARGEEARQGGPFSLHAAAQQVSEHGLRGNSSLHTKGSRGDVSRTPSLSGWSERGECVGLGASGGAGSSLSEGRPYTGSSLSEASAEGLGGLGRP